MDANLYHHPLEPLPYQEDLRNVFYRLVLPNYRWQKDNIMVELDDQRRVWFNCADETWCLLTPEEVNLNDLKERGVFLKYVVLLQLSKRFGEDSIAPLLKTNRFWSFKLPSPEEVMEVALPRISVVARLTENSCQILVASKIILLQESYEYVTHVWKTFTGGA